MKKYLILASAALVALAACNKEPVETPVLPDETVSALTFTSVRPQLDDVTRTAWDSETSSVVWQATDKIKVGFTFNDAWWAQTAAYSSENESPNNRIKFYQSDEVTLDDESANVGTFTVPTTFTGPTTSGDFVFYAVYPSALVDNNLDTAPSATVTLKTSQSPASDSFDASTDIMVATSAAITSTGLPSTPIELNWNRVVAHANLTFSNMAFDGTETPNKITLTFNDDAKVAGSFSVSIADGTIGAGSANEIVLEGSGLTASGSSIVTWATVLPVSFSSLNVEVKTDKATYVRSITGLNKTFQKNARNTLTINMATANRTASEQFDWVKKNLSEISSSDVFVIVGNNGDNYAMNHTSLNAKGAPTATAVTVSNNKLSTAPSEALQWTLSSDSNGYMFYPAGDNTKWLNLIADNNGLRVNNTDANGKYWSLDSGYLKGTDTKNATRYIGIYQSTDWRSYTSNGGNIANQTIAFYVRSASTPSKPVPTISFGTPTTEVNIGETVTNVATITPEGLTVTYSSSNEEIALVDDETGEVLGIAAGTATITASFAGNDIYDAASADYQITVVDPNVNDGSESKPYTADEAAALALAGNTSTVHVKGYISSIVEEYSSYGNTSFNISNNGSSSATQFEIFRVTATSVTDYMVGDYVVFQGTLKNYNGIAEFEAGSTKKTQVKAPRFTPNGGNFSGNSQSVTLTADSDAEIRYTIGETLPTPTTGTIYSEAITITATTTINALAIKDGIVTGIVTKTFTKIAGADVQFTTSDFDGQGTSGSGSKITATKSGITFTCDKGFGTTQIRCYKGGTITINAESGKTITGISFAFSGTYTGGLNATYTNLSTSSWSSGELGSQARLTSITVTYE